MSQLNPKFDALLLGPGSSLYYFTGIRWGLSERLLALLVLRSGEPFLISPAFEEGRMRDRVRAGIAYIRGETVLARILCAQGIAFVFFAAVLPVEVVYVKDAFCALMRDGAGHAQA